MAGNALTPAVAAARGTSPRRRWRNCHLLAGGLHDVPITDAVVLTEGPNIVWAGRAVEQPQFDPAAWLDVDLHGCWLTPGLIDCHTHLVFGGNRALEHEQRAQGMSYQEIQARGGGILSTVRATRGASDAALSAAASRRIVALQAEGVTGIEIKSGYGLDFEQEARLLAIARALGRSTGVAVHTSFLGAHALPPEFAGRADDYIDTIVRDWLPKLAARELCDSVDIYVETHAFNLEHARRLFDAAGALGLPVRMHAEQFANLGGSQLAAKYRALSCDHLEYASVAEAHALAESGTVAVLLPVAWQVLRESQRPPVAALRGAGVPMAVATDCNPGTAPGDSLLLAMHLAKHHFGLLSRELLAGVTSHAALALGWSGECGRVVAGLRADFAVWEIGGVEEFGYWVGHNPCVGTVRAGVADGKLTALLARENNA